MLEELGLTYESIYLDFQKGEHKAAEYLKVNPNGRIPALVDHKNNNFTVWYAPLGPAESMRCRPTLPSGSPELSFSTSSTSTTPSTS